MAARMTPREQLESGMSLHQAGRLNDAEGIYRQVLALQPENADALHLLGLLALQRGQPQISAELIARAIAILPEFAVAHNHFGCALQSMRRYDEAIAAHRRAVELRPTFVDAYYNLGNALREAGRYDAAIESYREAIRLKPDSAQAHNNLGNVLKTLGRFNEAIDAYRRAIQFKPDLLESYNNLGSALRNVGQFDEAIALLRHAMRLTPDVAEVNYNLGYALQSKGHLDEAIGFFQRALGLKPDYAEAFVNLGDALHDKGQYDQAIESYRRALALKPQLPQIHNNLGITFTVKGQYDQAVEAYRRAIAIRPDFAKAHNNLGNALRGKGELEPAIECYRQAIRFDQNYAVAFNNLGSALKDVGLIDEAIAAHQKALSLNSKSVEAHDNLIVTMHYHPASDAKTIYEETRRWNQQHAEPLKKFIERHKNARDPDRRLRIGYVSPDFREHPIGRFLLSLLPEHDADRFAIFCYADVQRPDPFTERLRRHGGQWRNILGMSDDRLAQLVRDDQIDVLVDLTMHMCGSRLLMFARKPAPVQVAYLAYCSTTGLDAMDYRLTDPYLDPSGTDESFYRERTIRLARTYWCYPVVENLPEVSPLPALSSGEVTFGCLNNFCKISPGALDLWIELLRSMPKARLVLHAYPGAHRQRVADHLNRQGIDPQRLSFADRAALPGYMSQYNRIDIGLDPFPFNGGTTTCDALWMGVPVVTLAGPLAVGRGGVSVLSNAGLPQLIAQTPQEYIQIATDLASDFPRLAEMRQTLRPRMLASPLMDSRQFARDIEAAYRHMWQNWCAAPQG